MRSVFASILLLLVAATSAFAMPIPFNPDQPVARITYEKHLYGYFHFKIDEAGVGRATAVFSQALWSSNDLSVQFAFYDGGGIQMWSGYMDAHMKATFNHSHEEHRALDIPFTKNDWARVKCVKVFWTRDNPPAIKEKFTFDIGDSVALQPEEVCF